MHIRSQRGPIRGRSQSSVRLNRKMGNHAQIDSQRMNRRHQRNRTGHNNCLAAGVRRRHLHLAALFRHLTAAFPFGVSHWSVGQKARHSRRANNHQQKDDHTDFGPEIQEANQPVNPILTKLGRNPNRKVTNVGFRLNCPTLSRQPREKTVAYLGGECRIAQIPAASSSYLAYYHLVTSK